MANAFVRSWRCPGCHRQQTDHEPRTLAEITPSVTQRCISCGTTIEVNVDKELKCWARKSVTPLPARYGDQPATVLTEPPVQQAV